MASRHPVALATTYSYDDDKRLRKVLFFRFLSARVPDGSFPLTGVLAVSVLLPGTIQWERRRAAAPPRLSCLREVFSLQTRGPTGRGRAELSFAGSAGELNAITQLREPCGGKRCDRAVETKGESIVNCTQPT